MKNVQNMSNIKTVFGVRAMVDCELFFVNDERYVIWIISIGYVMF